MASSRSRQGGEEVLIDRRGRFSLYGESVMARADWEALPKYAGVLAEPGSSGGGSGGAAAAAAAATAAATMRAHAAALEALAQQLGGGGGQAEGGSGTSPS